MKYNSFFTTPLIVAQVRFGFRGSRFRVQGFWTVGSRFRVLGSGLFID
jgi:hypothetical protein